ncbi:DUF6049 family protein [Microbacterium sp. NPDC096154]|uniref:DUF6049 family protein n=1 Tax=Microbacterium sp. NPDC096154 TaxID=3155549 RepID=UPI0033177FE4
MTSTHLTRGRAAHSRRRHLAPLPAAAFAVLVGLSCAGPVHAAVDGQDAAQLTVAAASQGVLRPGLPLTTTVTIENASSAPLDGGTAVLEIARTPLADREALRSWLRGEGDDISFTVIGTGSGDDVAPGQTDTVGITVDGDHAVIADLDPGVYPLRARFGQTSATSVVVVSDEAQPVGLVVPITTTVPVGGMLDAERLEALTAPDGALTAQLAAVGSDAILAVDPAIPAAIRALGERAPQSAREWLDRLMILPNDRFALQFGDADVAAQLQAGLPKPMRPLSLAGYLAPEAEPQPSTSPSPSPTVADAGEKDAEVALEDLLDIGDAAQSVYWPLPGSAVESVIDGLHAADDEAFTLTPSDATEQGADGSAVAAAGTTGGGAGVLVYDAGASAALAEVARTRDEVDRTAAAAEASAELWLAGQEAGDAPLLVALPRGAGAGTSQDGTGQDGTGQDGTGQDGGDVTPGGSDDGGSATGDVAPTETTPSGTPEATPSAEAEEDIPVIEDTMPDLEAQLTAAIDVVGLSSAVEPQDLDDLVAAEQERVTPLDTPADASRAAFVTEVGAAEEDVAVTATTLEDPEVLSGLVRAEALQVLAVGWDGRRAAWEDAVVTFRERTRGRADAVGIQPPTPVQLLSAGASLPVWIRNDLPYPVTVTLRTQPTDPRLDVADELTVTAGARSSTAVQVPVEARVGSGEVDIDLTLVSPTGELIGAPQTVEVTVRADWERIGLVVLVVLVVGLIGTGIVRTIRRRRRGAASAEPPGPEDQTPDAASADPDGQPAGPAAREAAGESASGQRAAGEEKDADA